MPKDSCPVEGAQKISAVFLVDRRASDAGVVLPLAVADAVRRSFRPAPAEAGEPAEGDSGDSGDPGDSRDEEAVVRHQLTSDRIVGLDTIVPDAVALKYTATPLTREQLAELIQIPPRQ